MTFDRKIFSQRLLELRRSKALTQTQLGEMAGIKKSAMAIMESGGSNPSIAVFCGLSDALGVPLDYLAGRDGNEPTRSFRKSADKGGEAPKSTFPKRLRQLRHDAGLTLAQVADKVGLTKATISDFERAKSSPSYAILESLANLFCCQADYLMGREALKPPPKWVAEIMADLEGLDPAGQAAVKALVKGLRK